MSSSPTRWQRFRRIPSLKRLLVFSSFAMMGALGSLGVGLVATKYVQITGGAINGFSSLPKLFQKSYGKSVFIGERRRINLLIVGIDYNHDSKGMPYSKGARSDTMMVASIGDEAQYLNVVSIPRDTYTVISEKIGSDKINAAYSYGGIKQTRETVSHFLGVPIHYYVIVKVQGAKKIFDALGGVPIDVEKDMDYDDNWGQLHIHLKKGPQILNGEQAVGYARFRHDEEGDYGRMRRQQQVIRAVIRRIKDPSIITKFGKLAQAVKDTLETDLTVEQMVDLALLYKGFDQSKMRSAQIKGDDDTVAGAMVIVPYEPENQKIVRRLLKDDIDLGLRDLRIRLINASGDSSLGVEVADEMNLEGFNVVKVEDFDHKTMVKTQITEAVQSPRVHARLKTLFPEASFTTSPDKNSDFDVTITLGSDRGFVAERSVRPAVSSSRLEQPQDYPISRTPETHTELQAQPEIREEPASDPVVEPQLEPDSAPHVSFPASLSQPAVSAPAVEQPEHVAPPVQVVSPPPQVAPAPAPAAPAPVPVAPPASDPLPLATPLN